MARATNFAYPQSDYALPNWKCELRCCSRCPSVNTPDQQTDYQYSDTRRSIQFQIYHIIVHCPTHERLP